jgi:Tfp pilus assembly protein PilF
MTARSGTSLVGEDGARVERLLKYCGRLHKSKDYYLASGMCARAHELDPTNPLPLLMMGDAFGELQRPQDAVVAYQKILQNDPVHAEALYRLGKAQMELGDQDMARTTLESAVYVNPKDARAHNALAILNDQIGDHATAQGHYRRALSLDPKNLSIASNYGLSLLLSGNKQESIKVLSKVVDDPRATATSHNNLAMAYAAPDPVEVPDAAIMADSSDEMSPVDGYGDETGDEGFDMTASEPEMESDSGMESDLEMESVEDDEIVHASFDPTADAGNLTVDQPLVLPPYKVDESITAVAAPLTLTYRATDIEQTSVVTNAGSDLPGPFMDHFEVISDDRGEEISAPATAAQGGISRNTVGGR